MKNKFFFFLGILAVAMGLCMIHFWGKSMIDPGKLNPNLTKSIVDKIMWAMLFLGAGISYILAGISFLKGVMPQKSNPKLLFTFMGIFVVGLFYMLVLGSPL